jgi:hypothetical protein
MRKKPRSVTLGKKRIAFTYDAATKTVTASTPSLSTRRGATVVVAGR